MQESKKVAPQQKKKYKSSFLEGLFSMLQDPQSNEIIAWSEDGRSFEIKKQREFVQFVAPRYYKLTSLSSFLKQINMYKFQRSYTSSNTLMISHPLFLRDHQDLYKAIERKHVPPRNSKADNETNDETSQMKESETNSKLEAPEKCRKTIKRAPVEDEKKLNEQNDRLEPVHKIHVESGEDPGRNTQEIQKSDPAKFMRGAFDLSPLQQGQPFDSRIISHFSNLHERSLSAHSNVYSMFPTPGAFDVPLLSQSQMNQTPMMTDPIVIASLLFLC